MPTTKAPSNTAPNLATAEDPSFTRLHITPLDPDLLQVVLPASTLPLARNISFHSIETFPEKRYGFVEIPTPDAEKLRKKLHGATLKGCKMKVEKARARQDAVPEAEAEPAEETPQTGKKRKSKRTGDGEKSSKKRKRDRNTVEGVMLEEGRKVKRGWTITEEEAKQEKKKNKKKNETKTKKRQKSRYTDKEECLMTITVPPNAPVLADSDGKKHKKSKKGKNARQITVHEFEQTKGFPTWLKSISNDTATKGVGKEGQKDPTAEEDEGISSSDSSSSSSNEESGVENEEPASTSLSPEVNETKKSKKGRKSTLQPMDDAPSLPSSPTQPGSGRPKSSSSMRSLTIKIPPPVTPAAEKVHPLEALYKKNKQDDALQETPAAKPFSFFGGGGEEDDKDTRPAPARSSQPPMTPFTTQEFEWRHVRSAAPTPDTAHPTKTRVFWAPDGGDDVEEEDEEDEEDEDEQEDLSRTATDDKLDEKGTEEAKETDFNKYFYEHRGELSRSWMDRKKAVKKQKRYRDNKWSRTSRGQ